MRYLFIVITLFIFIGCSQEENKDTNKIYSMEDLAVVGIKIKKDFQTDFPEATHAKWGFLKGREVAVFRYPTIELANTLGKTAGEEQTEEIEVVEKNIAHGPKVEKTECRGHKANKPNSSDVYKLDIKLNSNSFLSEIFIINKMKLLEGNSLNLFPLKPSWMECVRRAPMYTEFIIVGNLVILSEPLATEDSEGTIKFLQETAEKLP
ncbi:MAG: hypothetical protein CL764_05320 [Chloroflexi bacterium]|nr:hypothetical protein [Chloroflexota bacterium]|tara:strand:- start:526 stop:1146 length:621 start_codon:yes stop_codon:yes gene_type:complete